MATTLDGKKIAFLVAPEGAEQVELTEPWKAVEQAGGTPELISTEVGKIQAFNHLTPADTFEADKSADSVTASDYAGLVLPGGVANPDFLRMNAAAVAFAKSFFRRRQARRGDLPRALDAYRGRRGAGPEDHVVAQREDRSGQCRRRLGRRRGGRMFARPQHAGLQPQARRPARLLQHTGGSVLQGVKDPMGR